MEKHWNKDRCSQKAASENMEVILNKEARPKFEVMMAICFPDARELPIKIEPVD